MLWCAGLAGSDLLVSTGGQKVVVVAEKQKPTENKASHWRSAFKVALSQLPAACVCVPDVVQSLRLHRFCLLRVCLCRTQGHGHPLLDPRTLAKNAILGRLEI